MPISIDTILIVAHLPPRRAPSIADRQVVQFRFKTLDVGVRGFEVLVEPIALGDELPKRKRKRKENQGRDQYGVSLTDKHK